MSVKVHIRPQRYRYSHKVIIAHVDGDTVGECFDHLVRQFPGIEQDVFGEDGKLLSYVSIFVNGESTYPEDMAKPVKNDDRLYIMMIFPGG